MRMSVVVEGEDEDEEECGGWGKCQGSPSHSNSFTLIPNSSSKQFYSPESFLIKAYSILEISSDRA